MEMLKLDKPEQLDWCCFLSAMTMYCNNASQQWYVQREKSRDFVEEGVGGGGEQDSELGILLRIKAQLISLPKILCICNAFYYVTSRDIAI